MNFKTIYDYLANIEGACIIRDNGQYFLEENWLCLDHDKKISSTLFWAFYKKDLIALVSNYDGKNVYRPLLTRFHKKDHFSTAKIS